VVDARLAHRVLRTAPGRNGAHEPLGRAPEMSHGQSWGQRNARLDEPWTPMC
jgi:hypothetical protein